MFFMFVISKSMFLSSMKITISQLPTTWMHTSNWFNYLVNYNAVISTAGDGYSCPTMFEVCMTFNRTRPSRRDEQRWYENICIITLNQVWDRHSLELRQQSHDNDFMDS